MFSKIQTRLAKNRVILTIYHVHHMSTTNPESRNFIDFWWLYLQFYVNINKQSHCLKILRFIDLGFGCWHTENKILNSYDRKQFIFRNMFSCHNFSLPRFARSVSYLSFLHAKEDQRGVACLEPEKKSKLLFSFFFGFFMIKKYIFTNGQFSQLWLFPQL